MSSRNTNNLYWKVWGRLKFERRNTKKVSQLQNWMCQWPTTRAVWATSRTSQGFKNHFFLASKFPGKNKTTLQAPIMIILFTHMTTSASPKRRTRRLWRRKAAWFWRPLRRADITTTLYRYRSLAALSWASESCLNCCVSCFYSIPICFSHCIKIAADNPFDFFTGGAARSF